jgi:uncharacterized membrane protein YdbT with pleckstrin-like domain
MFAFILGAVVYGLVLYNIVWYFWGILILLAGVSITFLLVWLVRKTTTYIISSSSIRVDHGILIRKREEIPKRRIQGVDVRQNIIERFILKTGNVEFNSASGDHSAEVVFKGVRNPHRVADITHQEDVSVEQNNYNPSMPPSANYTSGLD